MTKKDYVVIAAALARTRPFLTPLAALQVARIFCEELEQENPAFNRTKFLIAAGFYEPNNTTSKEV